MNAPFFKFGLFGDDLSLVLAVVIGIGFGFFLEQAGFGSAMKLTAQFYLRDLAVFKVMFSAIVTAMLGVFYFTWLGWMDLSLVYVNPTYLIPQITGGVLLGIGFVVGGYCPGTSVVAASTGKFDGLIYLLGVVAGIFVFGEMYPLTEGFANATPMGASTLYDLTGISYGVLVFAVVLMAVGGFYGAEKVEAYFRKKDAEIGQ